MSRDILRDKIYLGALLHDIGKFYQRADPDGVAKSKLLSSSVKNSEAAVSYTHLYILNFLKLNQQFFLNFQKSFLTLYIGFSKINIFN